MKLGNIWTWIKGQKYFRNWIRYPKTWFVCDIGLLEWLALWIHVFTSLTFHDMWRNIRRRDVQNTSVVLGYCGMVYTLYTFSIIPCCYFLLETSEYMELTSSSCSKLRDKNDVKDLFIYLDYLKSENLSEQQCLPFKRDCKF